MGTQRLQLPQADRLALLVALLEAVSQNISGIPALSRTLSVTPRQVHYYAHAAQFLGLLSGEEGRFSLTEAGRKVLDAPLDRRFETIIGFLLAHPALADLLLPLAEEAEIDQRAIARAIESAGYGTATAERRAQTLIGWFRQAGLDLGQSLKAGCPVRDQLSIFEFAPAGEPAPEPLPPEEGALPEAPIVEEAPKEPPPTPREESPKPSPKKPPTEPPAPTPPRDVSGTRPLLFPVREKSAPRAEEPPRSPAPSIFDEEGPEETPRPPERPHPRGPVYTGVALRASLEPGHATIICKLRVGGRPAAVFEEVLSTREIVEAIVEEELAVVAVASPMWLPGEGITSDLAAHERYDPDLWLARPWTRSPFISALGFARVELEGSAPGLAARGRCLRMALAERGIAARMTPATQEDEGPRLIEVHPGLTLAALANAAEKTKEKISPGRRLRRVVEEEAGPVEIPAATDARHRDALCAAWTALKFAQGAAWCPEGSSLAGGFVIVPFLG